MALIINTIDLTKYDEQYVRCMKIHVWLVWKTFTQRQDIVRRYFIIMQQFNILTHKIRIIIRLLSSVNQKVVFVIENKGTWTTTDRRICQRDFQVS